MDEPARLLVILALQQGLGGGVEWISAEVTRRVEDDPRNLGLRASEIRRMVIEHVQDGGTVTQRRETRPEYFDRRDYWYRAIVPVDGMLRGLFVEIELTEADDEFPVVHLVNAHPQ